ncbi:hypothetical protein KC340_g12831 [Hortaea werneckii]|nr:hypothetical protein KC342_g9230 [Hortaea werneckii]KAI7072529.1 hypothetical protein KC339_g14298 [Hortaea werneckii]KAI7224953.1 hypothetical protein KC365_g10310 [Hortaea werneckii]KAI7302221.1 hypothetical protein KC340_g12831 [Hortaea werneckii]KAI7376710.1 hypothetical protein KC328_g14772 [Hortaea werneckii]
MTPASTEESLPSKTPAETISRWEMLRILTKARERNSHSGEEPTADKLPAFDGLDLNGPVDASTIEKLNVALHALAQEQQIQQESAMIEPQKQADAPSKLRSLMLPLAVAQAEHNDAVDLASGNLDPDMLFVEPSALKRSASAPSGRRGRVRSGHGIAPTSKPGKSETPDRESETSNAAARRDSRNLISGRNHVKTDSSVNPPTHQGPQSTVLRTAREHGDSRTKAETGQSQGPSATERTSPSCSTGARNFAPEGMGGDEREGQHERAIESPSQRSLPRGGNKAFDSIQNPTQRPIEGIRQARMTSAPRQPASENSSQGAGTDGLPRAVRRQEHDPWGKRLSGGKSQDRPVRDPHEKEKTDRVPPLQGSRTPATHGTQSLAGHAARDTSGRLPSASDPKSAHSGVGKGQLGGHHELLPKPLLRQAGSKPAERPAVVGSQESAAKGLAPGEPESKRDQHRATATPILSAPTHSLRPSPPAAGKVVRGLTARPNEGKQQDADLVQPRSNIATASSFGDPQRAGPIAGNPPLARETRQSEIRTAANTPPAAPESRRRMPQANSVTENNPSAAPSPNTQTTQSPPQNPKDSNTPPEPGRIDPRKEQEDDNIEGSLPSTSLELVDGDFTADEMFELFLEGRFPRDLSSQVNSISILQVMMRGALYSAQGWLGKETRKASVAIAEGFGLL